MVHGFSVVVMTGEGWEGKKEAMGKWMNGRDGGWVGGFLAN